MATKSKDQPKKNRKAGKAFLVHEPSVFYEERSKQSTRGKPVKIAADFDTALAALAAVPAKKRRKKSGRS